MTEMARKVVLAGGTAYNLEGLHPGLMEGLDNMPPNALERGIRQGAPNHKEAE